MKIHCCGALYVIYSNWYLEQLNGWLPSENRIQKMGCLWHWNIGQCDWWMSLFVVHQHHVNFERGVGQNLFSPSKPGYICQSYSLVQDCYNHSTWTCNNYHWKQTFKMATYDPEMYVKVTDEWHPSKNLWCIIMQIFKETS